MKIKFEFNGAVPKHIAFITVMIFGLAIAWITIIVGERIMQNVPDSKALSENKKLQQAIDETK